MKSTGGLNLTVIALALCSVQPAFAQESKKLTEGLSCANVTERLKQFREIKRKFNDSVAGMFDTTHDIVSRFGNQLRQYEGRTVYINYGGSRGLTDLADYLRRYHDLYQDTERNADEFLIDVAALLPSCITKSQVP